MDSYSVDTVSDFGIIPVGKDIYTGITHLIECDDTVIDSVGADNFSYVIRIDSESAVCYERSSCE